MYDSLAAALKAAAEISLLVGHEKDREGPEKTIELSTLRVIVSSWEGQF